MATRLGGICLDSLYDCNQTPEHTLWRSCTMTRWLAFAVAAAGLLPVCAHAQELDLIVHGGSVIDGSGSPAMAADIGIQGDRIVFVGSAGGRTA
jgi:adenine deaminase